jgi:uncharacterized protein YcbX
MRVNFIEVSLMKNVGTVKQIWRYPVKGMAGEQVEQCAIGPLGLQADRTWALRDSIRQEIQSCKFRPELLACTAKSGRDDSDHHVDITFPDGFLLSSKSDDIHQQLSELVGFKSTLEPLQPITNPDFYRRYKSADHDWLAELKHTFTREPGEQLPDFSDFPEQAQDFVTLPGTFFLVTPFHIITTSTMHEMQQRLPQADWDIRRFRPNIVIETYDEGFEEQDWIGKVLTIQRAAIQGGNNHGITIDCQATAPRCGAVTRKQQGIDSDKSMLRTIVKEADQNLGIYGSVRDTGTLQVGDTVYLD